jgi:membrane protein DedA with SNARE-associated domain
VIGPTTLIMKYGSFAVAGVVCLESMGLPLPGEAILIVAAIYAGKTGDLNIVEVIAAAAAGAIVGDNIGYWIGREIGFRLLLRYGSHVGLTEGRIKVGQYLFQRHGGKIVFFGRFIALLRVLAALLAGVNRMSWPRFFFFNAAGAILWATVFGLGAYTLGEEIERLTKPAAGLWPPPGWPRSSSGCCFCILIGRSSRPKLGAHCLGHLQREPSSAPRGDRVSATGRRPAKDEAAVLPIGSLYHAAFVRHPFPKHEGFQRFGDPASLLVLL